MNRCRLGRQWGEGRDKERYERERERGGRKEKGNVAEAACRVLQVWDCGACSPGFWAPGLSPLFTLLKSKPPSALRPTHCMSPVQRGMQGDFVSMIPEWQLEFVFWDSCRLFFLLWMPPLQACPFAIGWRAQAELLSVIMQTRGPSVRPCVGDDVRYVSSRLKGSDSYICHLNDGLKFDIKIWFTIIKHFHVNIKLVLKLYLYSVAWAISK